MPSSRDLCRRLSTSQIRGYANEFLKLRCQTRVELLCRVVRYLWPALLYFTVHLGSLIGNLHPVLRVMLARLPELPVLADSRVLAGYLFAIGKRVRYAWTLKESCASRDNSI